MTEHRAVNVRVFDHVAKLSEFLYLAAAQAVGLPAEHQPDTVTMAGGDELLTNHAHNEPEVSVRHHHGDPIPAGRFAVDDKDWTASLWVSSDRQVEPVVAQIGQCLDRLGVTWDAHEWVGLGSQVHPIGIPHRIATTATETEWEIEQ
jgi:hypothetical protein